MKKILTRREKEVFDLLVSNYDTKEISEQLNIAVKGRAQAMVELIRCREIEI